MQMYRHILGISGGFALKVYISEEVNGKFE